jgi:hypothetical protein
MLSQPRGEDFRSALRQQLNRASGVEVDQDRSIALPFAQGKIVNAQSSRCYRLKLGQLRDQPHEGIAAGRLVQACGDASAAPATEGDAKRAVTVGQAPRAARPRCNHVWHAFGKDALSAVR